MALPDPPHDDAPVQQKYARSALGRCLSRLQGRCAVGALGEFHMGERDRLLAARKGRRRLRRFLPAKATPRIISVIASAAKQSSLRCRGPGLLRCARNDGFGLLSYLIRSILGAALVNRIHPMAEVKVVEAGAAAGIVLNREGRKGREVQSRLLRDLRVLRG